MKKILFRMCLAAAVLCSSITVSSCDENSPWLQIIKNLLGTNTTYTYSGTATYQCLSEPNSQGAYTKTLANFSSRAVRCLSPPHRSMRPRLLWCCPQLRRMA